MRLMRLKKINGLCSALNRIASSVNADSPSLLTTNSKNKCKTKVNKLVLHSVENKKSDKH